MRRTLVLVIGFLVPSVVIALAVLFIVRGGQQREAAPIAVASAPLPSLQGAGGAASGFAPGSIEAPSLNKVEAAGPQFQEDGPEDDESTPEKPIAPAPAPPKKFGTVQEAAAGSCSTESVDGLSRQIIAQARCIKPNDFVPLPKRPNLEMAEHVYGYLDSGARDRLLKVLDAKKNTKMTINSALRTVAQQYLVRHWAGRKTCGVQMATAPGESNHETGTALDIAEAGTWRPLLEANEFKWLGASDRVHFDYKGKAPSRTATDVLAFQKLWNKNNKADIIAEDGRYSPATEQRLKKSPAGGFPLGPSCGKR